jgi:hypothetical protein
MEGVSQDMEAMKRPINDPAEGFRYRLADSERTQTASLDAELRSAVYARLGLQAEGGPGSPRRGLMGRRRRAVG